MTKVATIIDPALATTTNVNETAGATATVVTVEEPAKKKRGRPRKVVTEHTMSRGANGDLYEVDTVKKTCKKVLKNFADMNPDDLDLATMSMEPYRRYLLDTFPGEDAPIKKGMLHFRGYRISCNVENGFTVEDTQNKYVEVETDFEGIPTPRELGEFFNRPRKVHTPEEMKEAAERGKAKAKAIEKKLDEIKEEEETDLEKLRAKVLGMIWAIREGKRDKLEPKGFKDMIPHKKWRRQMNAEIKSWEGRKTRYATFLKNVEKFTTEIAFEEVKVNHRSDFVGTLLPEYKEVGVLRKDKIEVDGKLVEAVPFLVQVLLHYDPKVMQQLMRYAAGEVTDQFLIKNPYHEDHTITYNSKALKNSAHVARVITMVFESVGLVAPQDLLYTDELKVGDRILMFFEGEQKVKQIRSTEDGICIEKEIGLLKTDKWIYLPEKEVSIKR